MAGASVYSLKTMEKEKEEKISKGTALYRTRQLFLIERVILLGRLEVLERELQNLLPLRDNIYARVYIQWWEKFFRRPIIHRLLQLNEFLGINVPLLFTRL